MLQGGHPPMEHQFCQGILRSGIYAVRSADLKIKSVIILNLAGDIKVTVLSIQKWCIETKLHIHINRNTHANTPDNIPLLG